MAHIQSNMLLIQQSILNFESTVKNVLAQKHIDTFKNKRVSVADSEVAWMVQNNRINACLTEILENVAKKDRPATFEILLRNKQSRTNLVPRLRLCRVS